MRSRFDGAIVLAVVAVISLVSVTTEITADTAPCQASLTFSGLLIALQIVPGSTCVAISRYRHSALASCIWRGLLHSGSHKRGLPTTMTLDIAREVATLKRLRL